MGVLKQRAVGLAADCQNTLGGLAGLKAAPDFGGVDTLTHPNDRAKAHLQ